LTVGVVDVDDEGRPDPSTRTIQASDHGHEVHLFVWGSPDGVSMRVDACWRHLGAGRGTWLRVDHGRLRDVLVAPALAGACDAAGPFGFASMVGVFGAALQELAAGRNLDKLAGCA
jgi:hypothetical protein